MFQPFRPAVQGTFMLGHSIPRRPSEEPAFVQASCRKSAIWRLALYASEAGTLGVGLCRKSELSRKQIEDARNALGDAVALLRRMSVAPVPPSFPGYPPEHHRLTDGSEVDYLTVLLIGHGVIEVPTVILTARDADQVVVVQFYGRVLCGLEPGARICTDAKAVLQDLAQRVARRFSAQP